MSIQIESTIISLILSALFIFAIYWEYWDHARVSTLPDAEEVSDPKKREEYYIQLSCLNYDNGVSWRGVYIGTILTGIILWFVFRCRISSREYILSMLIIFAIFYGLSSLFTYHNNRLICGKANPHFNPM